MEASFDLIQHLYTKQLIDGELEFWLKYGIDKKHGGIFTALDEDGSLLDSDKSVWFQGRSLWTYMTAYERFGDKRYLEAAERILLFLDAHCFDSDGRMFFRVTECGEPIIKRMRYIFSETFAIIGYAAYGRITENQKYIDKAINLLRFTEEVRVAPGVLIPKMQRRSRSFGEPMIFLNVLSELKKACGNQEWINMRIDSCIAEINTYFVRDDLHVVLETCGEDGEVMDDHFEGRLLNPGHAIEGAWFIMNEGVERERDDFIRLGMKIHDWMFLLGWDEKYGGIIQYRDLMNRSLADYHQDMKFWWPQCEAAVSSLLAYSISKNDAYLKQFNMVHEYVQQHFIDKKYGGWFGYFHQDGTLSTPLKGNMYKGPFHVPRMYMKCLEIIEGLV